MTDIVDELKRAAAEIERLRAQVADLTRLAGCAAGSVPGVSVVSEQKSYYAEEIASQDRVYAFYRDQSK